MFRWGSRAFLHDVISQSRAAGSNYARPFYDRMDMDGFGVLIEEPGQACAPCSNKHYDERQGGERFYPGHPTDTSLDRAMIQQKLDTVQGCLTHR